MGYLNVPFVAIPFPYAKDNHQYYNAEYYKKNNSCWLIMQKDINDINLLDLLNTIIEQKDEYFLKKKNLTRITKKNTWENHKTKLTELVNEN